MRHLPAAEIVDAHFADIVVDGIVPEILVLLR
jgi:hypothetical protein